MKHQFFDPSTCDCDGSDHCVICDGGLALCQVCGLTEGCLTTDCPGQDAFKTHNEAVYAGELDYIDGRGWVEQASPHSPGTFAQRIKAVRS